MIKDKDTYLENILRACDYLRENLNGDIPAICVVLGSGLAPLADYVHVLQEFPYEDIPCFPLSTAPGHQGKLIYCDVDGKKVFLMSGRFHYYEGYDPSICTFYVRVMSRLGVKALFLTNAAGGMLDDMQPSDLMIVEDHISFFCESPLRGPNLYGFGERFIDQTHVYDQEFIHLLTELAKVNDIRLHKGVYCYTKGPQYETPAEIRMLKNLGVGAVGMSTVPEAIVAVHSNLRVVALSCITNLACGISKTPLSHNEVLENAEKASANSCQLVISFIKNVNLN